MKIVSIVKKIVSALMVLVIAVSASACSSSTSNINTSIGPDGYELPYMYNDGFKAKLKTVDDTSYFGVFTDLIGNKIIHLTTDKSEDEVKKYYNDYFSTLEEVELKDKTDDTKGYFDKDGRIIVYNLVVWTADGKTNYKMSCEQCENIADSKYWEEK